MKDKIIGEIHRFREEYARGFNYDLHAMCEDLRQRQQESGHKIMAWDARRKRMVPVKRLPVAKAKVVVK